MAISQLFFHYSFSYLIFATATFIEGLINPVLNALSIFQDGCANFSNNSGCTRFFLGTLFTPYFEYKLIKDYAFRIELCGRLTCSESGDATYEMTCAEGGL